MADRPIQKGSAPTAEGGAITAAETALVRKIAAWAHKRYCPADAKELITREDLYHTGIIGLLEARKKIDPHQNAEAYVATRIKGAIIDFIRRQSLVRVPRNQWQRVKAVRQAKTELEAVGQEATPEQVAGRLGWPVEAVKKAESVSLCIVSTSEDPDPDTGGAGGTNLAAKDALPDKNLFREDLAAVMEKCLHTMLNRIERMVLVCRVQHGVGLKVLAKVMGFSMEGIRQKQIRAQNRVKECLEKHGYSDGCLP